MTYAEIRALFSDDTNSVVHLYDRTWRYIGSWNPGHEWREALDWPKGPIAYVHDSNGKDKSWIIFCNGVRAAIGAFPEQADPVFMPDYDLVKDDYAEVNGYRVYPPQQTVDLNTLVAEALLDANLDAVIMEANTNERERE